MLFSLKNKWQYDKKQYDNDFPEEENRRKIPINIKKSQSLKYFMCDQSNNSDEEI